MDFLYQTTATTTYHEYKKFTWALILTKRAVVYFILFELICLFSAIVTKSIFFFSFLVLYPLIIWWFQNRHIKKVYQSNKVLQNAVSTYTFYEAYFTETNEFDHTKLEYQKLDKIIETKTNFYLMISKNQGFILTKENFPEGLIEFLRSIQI